MNSEKTGLTQTLISDRSDINAQIELEHILIEMKQGRMQHLRHFVDQYYCYKHGHVNKSGVAKWELIVWSGNVSLEARSTTDRKKVRKDHVVPLKVIREKLIKLSETGKATTDDIAALLDDYVRFATISKTEDERLLKSEMPDGFYTLGHKWYGDLFARYKLAKIEME